MSTVDDRVNLCLRCRCVPASRAHDWLHCEPCWQTVCDEGHQALAADRDGVAEQDGEEPP